MHAQLPLVLGLLGVMIIMFVVNKPRMDIVALMAVIALPVTGVITTDQALAGFSEPNIILIAALFVIGESLVRTGVVYLIGDKLIIFAGKSENKLLILLMLSVAGLGSVMSSTGVVAIFIPVALSMAKKLDIAPSRLLMPLAFAGLISGMLTLVATPPNMVINAELVRSGLPGFSFFSFTPLGLVILVLGIGYMLIVRNFFKLGSDHNSKRARFTLIDLAKSYELDKREAQFKVQANSILLGKPLNEFALRKEYGINIIAIERRRNFRSFLLTAQSGTILEAYDVLLVDIIPVEINILEICHKLGLHSIPLQQSFFSLHARELGLAEIAIPPESKLLGSSISELGFRSKYKLNVVGIRREGVALNGVLVEEKLGAKDILLVAGNWSAIANLQGKSRNFVLLSVADEAGENTPAARKAPYALLVLFLMVIMMASGIVSNVLAALISCLLLGVFKCIDINSAYKSIHFPTIILIVGMLPFATALQQTGAIDLAVNTLLAVAGDFGNHLILACLFMVTAIIGLFISNTATAVLMGPVAIGTAQTLQLSVLPFAMTVAFAASSAFMTPVSSPVNTLVLVPGNYKFSDFLKIGVPFTLLVMSVCVVLIPVLFAF